MTTSSREVTARQDRHIRRIHLIDGYVPLFVRNTLKSIVCAVFNILLSHTYHVCKAAENNLDRSDAIQVIVVLLLLLLLLTFLFY